MTEPMEHDPMTVVLDTQIPALMSEASRISDEIGSLAATHLGQDTGIMIHLGLMESLTNIIRHGYKGRPDCTISIRGEAEPSHWSFTIVDRGTPIPATILEAADGSVFDFDPGSLMDVPTGGMGLSLMRAVFERVEYNVEPEGNQLTLTKIRCEELV